MFRHRRHIRARSNEWIHVYRNGQRSNHWDLPQLVGMGAGLLILAALIWELIKATWPYLIVAGVIAAIFRSRRRF